MGLSLLLDYVLPPNSVLYKHCNGGWDFFMTDDDFDNGESYMSQDCNENVHTFLERLIQKLMEDEKNDPEPLVTIDYAIWVNHKNQTT